MHLDTKASRKVIPPAAPGRRVPSVVLASLSRIAAAAVGITALALVQTDAADDLTLAQWRALVVIGSSEGMRVGEVAERIGASGPSASRFVRRLERRGLVTTERDELDRRATVVRPTSRGAAVRIRVMNRRTELLAELVTGPSAPLPADLVSGLDEIANRIERFEDGPRATPG